MPPVAPTLGARGKRRGNMDAIQEGISIRLRSQLDGRQENNSQPTVDQWAGILHRFIIVALCSFAATFEAMEASFFQWEQVLQNPSRRNLMDDIQPQEFITEENLNYKEKEMSEDEGVSKDNETIKTSNVPSPAATEEQPSEAIHHSRPLTFDPRPLEEEDEHTMLAASNDQAELM